MESALLPEEVSLPNVRGQNPGEPLDQGGERSQREKQQYDAAPIGLYEGEEPFHLIGFAG